MPLHEVLRLLTTSSQSGALLLTDEEGTTALGAVYLNLGQIVEARVEGHSGLDALSEMCRIPATGFIFNDKEGTSSSKLASYPNARLIDKVEKAVTEHTKFQEMRPNPEDVPIYLSAKEVAGIHATPDELNLLLHCRGQSTVEQISTELGMELESIRNTMAKFRQAGMLGLKESAAVEEPEAVEAVEEGVEEVSEEAKDGAKEAKARKKTSRYWRGRRIG